MELVMTDNAAIAVAATGGAAGPQDEDGPELVITIPETWRLELVWPCQLTRIDTAVAGAFLLAVAYVVADLFPQSDQIAQTWIFMRLLLVLAGLYGAFGVLCTLWNKLCNAPVTVASPRVDLRPRELKRELTERWIDQLPSEEQKKVGEDFIDPVGDGALGEVGLEITDSKSNIGEVLAHHISLEEKRAKNAQPMIAESGCPGGDVAWSTVPEKKSWPQEKHLEVSESFLKPAEIPEIRASYFDSSLPQEGLNFTDESPEDTAESSTPVDESDSCKEPGDVVQGLLSDMTTSKEESDSLDVGEEQGAVGPEKLADEYEVLPARPPSQPAGASSAYSISQAFMSERNALTGEAGASHAFLGERNAVTGETVSQSGGAFLPRNALTDETVGPFSHSIGAFLAERNALSDEMYARLEKITALQERSVSSQTAGEYAMGYGGHLSLACPHRHCCRNHADHGQAMDFKESCFVKADLLDDSRPMPGSYFGVSRSITDHSSKFHLTVIPEDDLPQIV